MFGVFGVISIILTIIKIIKEKLEKPAPANQRFDWDAYWDDVGKISTMEQIKKQERGEYYTTKPKPLDWWELPLDTVVDVERYEYDKKRYEYVAETRRENGYYRQIKPFNRIDE